MIIVIVVVIVTTILKPSTPKVLFGQPKPNIEIVIDESSKDDTDTVIDVPDNTDASGNDV